MSRHHNPSDAEYFTQRAADEAARAEACKDPQIATIHHELAAKYRELAALSDDRPRLRIITD